MRNLRLFLSYPTKDKTALCLLVSLIMAMLLSFPIKSHAAPSGLYPSKYAAIVVDANNGKVLFSRSADRRRYPASLTKMMTLYLLFDAMQEGRVNANTRIPVSAHARSQPPTKLYFKPGETIKVEDAAKALITKSANDVAAAIAEYLGGSEKKFAKMMNLKARQLGMRRTNFVNASGLPSKYNYSTARDLSLLAIALNKHFPQQYALFNTTQFVHRGRTIRGHNRLVSKMQGVDGIKTGYTRMSGFNLASSRHVGNKRIVAIVMGGKTSSLRDKYMTVLLNKYMGQASGRKMIVPVPEKSPVLLASADVPIPMAKVISGTATEEDKVTMLAEADIDEIDVAPIPVAAPDDHMNDRERDSALLMMLASQSVNSVNDQAAVQAIDEAIANDIPVPSKKKDTIDNIVTASIPKQAPKDSLESGWIVQLAASDSKAQAESILDKAEHIIHNNFDNKKRYTEEYVKQGNSYYRARFAGFTSKQEARNSCSILKKHGYSCIALAG